MFKDEDIIGIYRFEKYVKAPNTNSFTIAGAKVPKGAVLKVTHQAIVNITTTGKTLLLGRRDVNEVEHFYGAGITTNNLGVQLHGEALLIENEKPIGRVLSPAQNDELYFSAYGILYRSTP